MLKVSLSRGGGCPGEAPRRSAPANRPDSPLLAPTLDAPPTLGGLPEPVKVHLDWAYDSTVTRRLLHERGLQGAISEKGKPAPLGATKRWVVERTNSWQNAHKKLVWCTEREGRVIDFCIAFSKRSSSWVGSSEKPGLTIVGRAELIADHDLLAQALSDRKMHKRTERGVPGRIVGCATLTKLPAGV